MEKKAKVLRYCVESARLGERKLDVFDAMYQTNLNYEEFKIALNALAESQEVETIDTRFFTFVGSAEQEVAEVENRDFNATKKVGEDSRIEAARRKEQLIARLRDNLPGSVATENRNKSERTENGNKEEAYREFLFGDEYEEDNYRPVESEESVDISLLEELADADVPDSKSELVEFAKIYVKRLNGAFMWRCGEGDVLLHIKRLKFRSGDDVYFHLVMDDNGVLLTDGGYTRKTLSEKNKIGDLGADEKITQFIANKEIDYLQGVLRLKTSLNSAISELMYFYWAIQSLLE